MEFWSYRHITPDVIDLHNIGAEAISQLFGDCKTIGFQEDIFRHMVMFEHTIVLDVGKYKVYTFRSLS